MCRLAAYLGNPISLQQFLLEPPHSLMVQAWAPKELVYAKLNADGFGIGWFADDRKPAAYTNVLPIWSDTNLKHLGRSLATPLWVGMVRSATEGNPVNHANTQPFYDDELLFTHNGFIAEFHTGLRAGIECQLAPAIRTGIQGNTDSEYLFALLRQQLSNDAELAIEQAIQAMCRQLDDQLNGTQALLNFIISDGERLYAVRHAHHHPCPSLYYTTDDDSFPGGQLVASERLTESEFWQPVPEHHLLILDREEPPELIAL